ncbi:MAG: 2Fe-2S iron-sulfur cluster-binding protein [Pseudomonadota bacterium]
MPSITYIEYDGTEHVVDAPVGMSLMQAALNNNIPGIDADCGGQCACATCHVFVEPDWLEQTGARNDMEDSMLDFAAEVRDNSRLACQVEVSESMDGLTVRMPESQH